MPVSIAPRQDPVGFAALEGAELDQGEGPPGGDPVSLGGHEGGSFKTWGAQPVGASWEGQGRWGGGWGLVPGDVGIGRGLGGL